MKLKVVLLFSFCSLLLLSACQQERKLRFTLQDVSLLAEGPLTEGSNTAQGSCEGALNKFLQDNNLKIEQLGDIHIVGAELNVPDSVGFDLVKSITLQFASDAADMIDAGIANPVPAGTRNLKLQVPQDAKNLLPTLKQPSFTVVADLDIRQDTSMNFPLTANFEFEVSAK